VKGENLFTMPGGSESGRTSLIIERMEQRRTVSVDLKDAEGKVVLEYGWNGRKGMYHARLAKTVAVKLLEKKKGSGGRVGKYL
jgi:hypothetical protein